MVACLSLTFFPLQSSAATITEPTTVVNPKPAEAVEAKTLLLRLDEISATDMSKMKSSDKKNLRKEVRNINHRLNTISGGVYISAGAAILIILLLIILL
jgi:hypothetical protein